MVIDPAIIRGELLSRPSICRHDANSVKGGIELEARGAVPKLMCHLLTALPPNCKIVFADSHGKTNWAKGLKVEVELDGEEHAYFLKVCVPSSWTLTASISLSPSTDHGARKRPSHGPWRV